ncbi:Ca(2+)/calmodulin-dependent protein kinase phosphatase [Entamoeba marina]
MSSILRTTTPTIICPTTPTTPDIPSQPRMLHRRVRSTDRVSKNTFYGQERPTFVNGKVVMSSSIVLPRMSSSYLLEKDKEPVRGKSGQSFDENKTDSLLQGDTFTSSKRFDFGEAQTIGKRLYMEDIVLIKGNFAENLDNFFTDNYHSYLLDLFQTIHDGIIKETESGTTASIAFVREKDVIIAICGDSPVFTLKGTNLSKIGKDHNTSNSDEVEAIKQRGGDVVDAGGVLRVNSQIQITRSLGDSKLHPPLIATPDIICLNLNDIDNLIICSDGVDVLEQLLGLLTQPTSPESQAQYLRNSAFEKNSKDNISVVVFATQPKKLIPLSF